MNEMTLPSRRRIKHLSPGRARKFLVTDTPQNFECLRMIGEETFCAILVLKAVMSFCPGSVHDKEPL